MPHHRTYLHSQHLRSPFRNLYIHTSPPSLSKSPLSIFGQHPSSLHSRSTICILSVPQQMHDFSKSPSSLTQTNHLAWAVPFQPPFSIPDLHSTHVSHTALWAVPFQPPFSIPDLHSLAHCPLGGPLPASILHSRSPLTRTLPFAALGRSLPASNLHSRSPFARIYFYFCSHSIPPFLGAVPFRLPFPFSDLVPDDGARATTFAEAQRWHQV